MDVVLVSTYELGRQPFGLASPAAWLKREGASVACLDLAVQDFDEGLLSSAALVAFYLPMHMATRLAAPVLSRVRRLNAQAHICCYGLYAPMNAPYLRKLGARTILGGEFETGLVALYRGLADGVHNRAAVAEEEARRLVKQRFLVPDRGQLPPLSAYARLRIGASAERVAGYTEASRGCKHLCRHCPVVPVYNGRFRVVQPEIVVEDVRRQVAAGAQHVTFGDPDFFNGIRHAVRIVEAVHAEFPTLSYDVTIKIEHLLKHARHLPALRDTGCLFVTSAVEAVDDGILEILDKGHTRADFVEAVALLRELGLKLAPTFVPFTPWTSLDGYIELLALLASLDLVQETSPIQLAIRLLIPAGSRLLKGAETWPFIEAWDAARLSYRWSHPDPRLERLYAAVGRAVRRGEANGEARAKIFAEIWRLAHEAAGRRPPPLGVPRGRSTATAMPTMSEPWYCCAEPTEEQFIRI